MSVPEIFFSTSFSAKRSISGRSKSVIFLPSRSCTKLLSDQFYSGTPRSTFSSVYTATIAVRMEYSVVKMVSRGTSAN